MAEDFELPDYINKYDLDRFKATNTPFGGAEKSERRLLRLGLLTLALLCIIQAALNLSLRLACAGKRTGPLTGEHPTAFQGYNAE
ncbi:hypothetical protein XENOCAPTIV_003848 [Xenoophorus captivus]|uniref:Uncharacterized protein n=1 Tax=Xenoophorus captivus TaxID=1517983 RepID=A0ABV0RFG8_9TELE